MRQLKEIFAGLFLLMVIQAYLNTHYVKSLGTRSDVLRMESAVNAPSNLWIENPSDDYPGEVRDQTFPLFCVERSAYKERNNSNPPVQQSLLDPLFLDRPPPPAIFVSS